jgi:hypothetical protein
MGSGGMTWIVVLFLVAHGLVHVGLWCTPFDPAKAPFDPRRSWIAARLGLEKAARRVSVAFAVVAALAFVAAGIAVMAGASWAPAAAITGAVISLLLTVLCFHRWLVLNLLINAAIIAVALQ